MKNIAVCIMAAWWFAACGNPVTSPERVDEWPDIYPDYIGVTIPATIAPMNFNCIGGAYERVDVTVTGGKSGVHKPFHPLICSNKSDFLSSAFFYSFF